MKALFLNCTLKGGDMTSHTEGLIRDIIPHFDALDVESEIVRIVDYNVTFGVTEDEGDGDEWPQIFEKVKAANIVVIGTPLWLGEKSS
ncbi:MAG: NAD(P)H-dependent oxidoreductase, partial [Exiguobacterium sp.]|nr:NAD(P)H-dependent oxidoreductase [Exiguobacterium sp.]